MKCILCAAADGQFNEGMGGSFNETRRAAFKLQCYHNLEHFLFKMLFTDSVPMHLKSKKVAENAFQAQKIAVNMRQKSVNHKTTKIVVPKRLFCKEYAIQLLKYPIPTASAARPSVCHKNCHMAIPWEPSVVS